MLTCLDASAHTKKSVLALGMFDGVHIGHAVLLRRARTLANRAHAPLVCATFTNHPLALLAPERVPPMLATLDERAARMAALGVDVLCAQPFDRRLMDTPPEDFVGQLVRRWHPVAVVAGYNYTFGKAGAGTPALLLGLGPALGFEVSVVPEIRLRGAEVSSTAIRALLARGAVSRAAAMLGAPYAQEAVALACEGRRALLRPVEDGKQTVGPGRYRVLVNAGDTQAPALARVDADGRIRCALCQPLEPGTGLRLTWLAELNPDDRPEGSAAP